MVLNNILVSVGTITSLLILGAGSPAQQQDHSRHPANPVGSVQVAQSLDDFPIPDDAVNLTEQPGTGVGGSVNFQTEMTLAEAMDFYRTALEEQGLKEREINTAVTESTFNLVFEGAPDDLFVVVQGVNLGERRNVNIRYERLN
ncbi:MAG: hypothetical protein ACFBSC_17175 [Microcoleaceae cyanobacterium]